MKLLNLLCLLLFCCGPAGADEQRTIEVTAQSSIKVVPDEVRLGLAVDVTAETLLEAKAENDDISAAIIALAPKFTVRPEDIEITNMHVQPNYKNSIYGGRASGGAPISFDVKRSIQVRLTDFTQIEHLLTAAFQAGLTNVSYLQFRVSNQRDHQFKARAKAVEFAKEKAEHLVSLTNMRLGSPTTIREDVEYNYRGGGFGGGGFGGSIGSNTTPPVGPLHLKKFLLTKLPDSAPSDENAQKPLIAPGQVTLRATVNIVYEMHLPD